MKSTLFLLSFVLGGQCIDLCGDWPQYGATKCIKVIPQIGTEREALGNCTKLDPQATLPSIHSKEDQEYLLNFVKDHIGMSDKVWIGMKWSGNGRYDWMDTTPSDYTNWSNDSVRDGSDPCVQMSLNGQTRGEWTDESCTKKALILCQKKPALTLDVLLVAINKQEDRIVQLEKGNGSTNLPIGFLYTQLPNQSSAESLWPDLKWQEVTQQYAGLFFRVEGLGSEKFGSVQESNTTTIVATHSQCIKGGFTNVNHYDKIWGLTAGKWQDEGVGDQGQCAAGDSLGDMSLFMSSGENRPKNTAIKIWKRI